MNKIFEKMPFKRTLEKMIPNEIISKYLILNKFVQYSNQIICLIVLLLLANVMFDGGVGGSSGVSHKDFIGTWVGGHFQYTITANEITSTTTYSDGKTTVYAGRITDVTPMSQNNLNYPTGYRFSYPGFTRTFYMHTAKKEFIEYSNYVNLIYKKQ